MTFRLSKLHGLGNDFLVHLTDDETMLRDPGVWSDRARHWCDRRRGIGADGLILGVSGAAPTELVMILHNADGSRAEMSGNGIRCLVHAEARRQGRPEGSWVVATDGGERTVEIVTDPSGDPLMMTSAVDMGPGGAGPVANGTPTLPDPTLVTPVDQGDLGLVPQDRSISNPNGEGGHGPGQTDSRPSAEERLARRPKEAATFDMGNPHLVLLVDDPSVVDIETVGAAWDKCFDDGINVHAVAPTPHEYDAMTMAIWERGVGPTAACGTGAAAVARAAAGWGLVGNRVTVHMPGGDVVVDVGDTLILHGPSVFVADIEVPR